MNEFDWIIEAPIYKHFHPHTVYYFVEGGKTVDDIISRVDPSQMIGHEKTLIEWLVWADEGENKLKYFIFDEDMEIEGWCDETTVKDCLDFYYPIIKFTYVKIDDFFG